MSKSFPISQYVGKTPFPYTQLNRQQINLFIRIEDSIITQQSETPEATYSDSVSSPLTTLMRKQGGLKN